MGDQSCTNQYRPRGVQHVDLSTMRARLISVMGD